MPLRFFSKSEAVLFAWNALKRDPAFLSGLQLLILSLLLLAAVPGFSLPSFALPSLALPGAPQEIAAGAAFIAACALVEAGAVRISLKICDGERPTYGDLLPRCSGARTTSRYVAGFALYWLIVTLGLVFFIVPGVYLALRHGLYGHLIIDRGMGPLEALNGSARLTRGVRKNLLLLRLMLWGITVLGVLSLGIGVIAAVPVSWISTAYVYRRLLLQSENEGARALPEPRCVFC